MEVHSAPGPPRTHIVVGAGHRIATLEVQAHRDRGHVELADRTRWTLERPPGAGEGWASDASGRHLATLTRHGPVREHFGVRLGDLDLEVVPVGPLWQRRWEVRDPGQRALLEVRQRWLARPVHDVQVRSGDLPPELPLLIAWTVALAVGPRISETRRPRWTAA